MRTGTVQAKSASTTTGVAGSLSGGRQQIRQGHADQRPHLVLPHCEGKYDLVLVNVPSMYQQGPIDDGEEPPWGLLRVAAAARGCHGLNVGILDAHRLRLEPAQILAQIRRSGAKVVGVNPTSVNVPETRVVTDACYRLGIPFVLGGVHATLDPTLARRGFPNAAAIVRGSGEVVIGDMIRAILSGQCAVQLPGVYFRDVEYEDYSGYAVEMDLDMVPPVDQTLLVANPIHEQVAEIRGERRTLREASVFVTAGCPFSCGFCCSPVLSGGGGHRYRRPSMARIIRDVQHCVRDLGANAIHFMDDMAFACADHIRALHTGLAETGLLGRFAWRSMTRAPVLLKPSFTDDVFQMMVESGCWKLAMGVESGSDEVLQRIRKQITTAQVVAAVKKTACFGIQVKAFFIMGFPGETEAQIRQTRTFIRHLRAIGLTEISLFQFKPYPGTAEFERLKAENPSVLKRLTYLRLADERGLADKVRSKAGQHDTWLPDDLRIAEIPSGEVKRHVLGTLQEFYG